MIGQLLLAVRQLPALTGRLIVRVCLRLSLSLICEPQEIKQLMGTSSATRVTRLNVARAKHIIGFGAIWESTVRIHDRKPRAQEIGSVRVLYLLRQMPELNRDRIASHCIASHRIASHRIASHRIASHRIASHRIAIAATREMLQSLAQTARQRGGGGGSGGGGVRGFICSEGRRGVCGPVHTGSGVGVVLVCGDGGGEGGRGGRAAGPAVRDAHQRAAHARRALQRTGASVRQPVGAAHGALLSPDAQIQLPACTLPLPEKTEEYSVTLTASGSVHLGHCSSSDTPSPAAARPVSGSTSGVEWLLHAIVRYEYDG